MALNIRRGRTYKQARIGSGGSVISNEVVRKWIERLRVTGFAGNEIIPDVVDAELWHFRVGLESRSASERDQYSQITKVVAKIKNARYTKGLLMSYGGFGDIFACRRRTETHSDGVVMKRQLLMRMPKNSEGYPYEVEYAELLSKCTPRFVPELYDSYEDGVESVMIMERVPGLDLLDYCNVNVVNVVEVVNIVRQLWHIVFELDHMKEKLYHGDLKMENLMWNGSKLVLIDFGGMYSSYEVAKPQKHLTVSYVAPELQDPNRFGEPTYIGGELWAMGILIYALRVGEFPFNKLTEMLTEPLQLPTGLGGFERLLAGLLEKHVARRMTLDMVQTWLTSYKSPSLSAPPSLRFGMEARKRKWSSSSSDDEDYDEMKSGWNDVTTRTSWITIVSLWVYRGEGLIRT